MKSLSLIDISVPLLKDYATFEKTLLVSINDERVQKGEGTLSDEEAMDMYLDLLNKHKLNVKS